MTPSCRLNSYAVVFVHYLTKWPEVYPISDQTTFTIPKLYGVPKKTIYDRGAVFLSRLMCNVYHLLGVHKLITTAYDLRTDRLVERTL